MTLNDLLREIQNKFCTIPVSNYWELFRGARAQVVGSFLVVFCMSALWVRSMDEPENSRIAPPSIKFSVFQFFTKYLSKRTESSDVTTI